ncbi:2-C-methyl-D-erythritol 4-phosphate cytidylyltransferase [Faecalimonas sp.]
MDKKRCTAIVLSAGQGTRMGMNIQKQYIQLDGKEIICHTLETFQKSEIIDEIILVVGIGQEEYCCKEIVEKYQFKKVKKIIEGGVERYHSVYNGLKEIKHQGYVFIHDGARPFITEEIIERAYVTVCKYGACAIGMPVKDTVKIADQEKFIEETPNRKLVWLVQTPQVFQTDIVKEAYEKMIQSNDIQVTDDAMVVETMLHKKIKLVEGSYENIKITTPEDLDIAKVFLKRRYDG